jgi:hypothetical protein
MSEGWKCEIVPIPDEVRGTMSPTTFADSIMYMCFVDVIKMERENADK